MENLEARGVYQEENDLPTKNGPTESDYVNFDEAFVRFSGIWHFILDAIDKGKNPIKNRNS